MSKKTYIPWYDSFELAKNICDIEDDEDDFDLVEKCIHDKLGCNMETFHRIVEHLLPMASSAKCNLSDKFFYTGFVNHEDGSVIIKCLHEIPSSKKDK